MSVEGQTSKYINSLNCFCRKPLWRLLTYIFYLPCSLFFSLFFVVPLALLNCLVVQLWCRLMSACLLWTVYFIVSFQVFMKFWICPVVHWATNHQCMWKLWWHWSLCTDNLRWLVMLVWPITMWWILLLLSRVRTIVWKYDNRYYRSEQSADARSMR